ncbi:prolyl endopeptidase-like isoform X7 [Phalacrocorax aristotelis]|uniref:prolyl endopeptidase-like isoform X7 n=1 Tax=Phalacrocorax aristotelis TaxID=126867 RepID=UPI003F4BB765
MLCIFHICGVIWDFQQFQVDYQEMKVRMSRVGLRNLLQGLSFSVRYYFKHNHLETICLYSKVKPKKCHILDCSGSTCTHRTVPPGSILPWRSFSCKQEGTKIPSKRKENTSITTPELLYENLLKSEQENWNDISARYNAMTERIKEKLEELHKYTFNSGSPRMRFGENVYFEDNGCIFLSKADDEWATNDVLYYTSQKNLKCQNVFMTTFTNQKYTKLVYTEQDARFFVDIYCTKDRRFLTINSNSKTTSEVWLVDCRHPFKLPALVQARTKGVIYHIEHRNDELYILTTYGEPAEYKLMKAPVASSGVENWQLVYALEEKTKIVDLEMFSDHCILFLKNAGHLYLTVISFVSHSVQSIKLPTWACEFELESHPEHTTSTCYFQLTSPVHPPKRFAYSFKENNLIEQAVQEVPIITKCHTTRLLAKSKDETLVPITVFHNMNSKELHRKPLLVHVYGAYGIDLNMSFKEEKLMLIEEGWILAYCHVRGGGELGLSWHKDGCQHNKLKGLHDLKACIMLLHELGFSQPKYTALVAASAGGALAGALCNTDPELIRAMVLQAPFVDVLNTMMQTHLPLTIEEQEEWGNPLADEKCMEYIKSYCPYQNIKTQCYPSVFITAYENDQRIPLTGVLRYVQKLRKAALDHTKRTSKKGNWIPNIILDIQANGSHCDSSWENSLNEVARHLAFLNKELEEACHLHHHTKSCN